MNTEPESFPIVTIDPVAVFPSLGEIPQPPVTLHMRGSLARTEGTIFLAVVGSRKYTPYGKQVCESLIRGLSGYPITVVSGLALGIDTIAHQSALSAGLSTIAFPGSGLQWDMLYPVQNTSLARDILQSGGALLSEFSHTTRGNSWTFPQRNRLIAGVASMTLIIEAEEKSGTLITARLATEYNKTVGAVPGPITSTTSAGAHWLLKQGAVPVTDSLDILRELGLEDQLHPKRTPELLLNDEEERIVEYLTQPRLKDDIIEALGLEPSTANITFSTLEIKGVIRETLGLIERTSC